MEREISLLRHLIGSLLSLVVCVCVMCVYLCVIHVCVGIGVHVNVRGQLWETVLFPLGGIWNWNSGLQVLE